MRAASWAWLLLMLLPPAGIAAARLSQALLVVETSVQHMHFALDSVDLTLDGVKLRTQLLAPDKVRIEHLRVKRMTLELNSSAGPTPVPVLPASLALPLPLSVEEADVEELILLSGTRRQVLTQVRFRFSGDARQLRLEQASAVTPWGRLALQLELEAAVPHALSGQIRLEQTATAHPYRLQTTLSGQLDRITALLEGSLHDTPLAARAELTPFLPVPLASLQVNASAINLHTWQSGLPASRYKLEIKANGVAVADRWALQGRLQAGQSASPSLPQQIDAEFSLSEQALNVSSLVAQLGNGARFTARGEQHWQGEQTLRWQGTLQGLNPSVYGAYPEGKIKAHWDWQGKLLPLAQTRFSLRLAESQLGGQALVGEAVVENAGDRLPAVEARFTLGSSEIKLQGAYGEAGDRLSWQARLDDLSHLSAEWAGKLVASGAWLSHPKLPGFEFQLQGEALRLSAALRLDAVKARGSLAPGQPGALQAEARLDGYQSAALQLAHASLSVAGTRAQHRLVLHTDDPAHALQLALAGTLDNGGWRGTFEQLRHSGAFNLALQAPARFEVSEKGVALDGAKLQIEAGTLDLATLRYGGGHLDSSGHARGLPVSLLVPWLGEGFSRASTLTLSADWKLQAATVLNGHLRVWRESGDLIQNNPSRAWQLDRLEARATFDAGRANATLELSGSGIGEARLQAESRLGNDVSPLALAVTAPLKFSARARLNSLSWLNAVSGMAAARLDGRLRLDLQGGGHLAQPELNGELELDQLQLEMLEQGIALQQGKLSASFAGQRLLIREARWQGKTGSAGFGGTINFADLHAAADLAFHAQDFTLMARTDRHLVISGNGTLNASPGALALRGGFVVERGLVELPPDSAPTLGEDVVILGRERQEPAPILPPMVEIDLGIDLGQKFRLQGRGLDTLLTGALHFTKAPGGELRTDGSLRTEQGTFLAYGQTLVIERGVINFSGPVDNPGLDVLAVRKNQAVKAGLEISGNVKQPLIKLVSSPEVPDSEKLSWLVLGHGSDQADKNEFAMLSLAAGALFSQGDSVPLQTRFARAAGLDEIGFARGNTTPDGRQETVVNLGKRLSSNLYLNYERGLYGLQDVVKVTYDITQNWSVHGLTGSQTGADLFYTLSFD